MLRIRAENGRLLGGGKMASVIIPAGPRGGIGLNIDMQHYKSRLLSGCGVTASRPSLSPMTRTCTILIVSAPRKCTFLVEQHAAVI